MKRWKHKAGIILMFVMVCAFFIPYKTYAKESASVTIYEGHRGVEFQFYLLAEVNENQGLNITKAFEDYPIDWQQSSAEDWMGVAQILEGYIKRDDVQPTYRGTTDSEGNVKLDNLRLGLYLIIGESYELDGTRYLLSPIIQALPYHAGDTKIYDLEVWSKGRQIREGDMHYNVVKIWDGDIISGKHPTQVTVQLLRNQEVYEEIVLNEKNSWKHTFYELSNEYEWTVVEKEVWDNYSVKLEITDNNYVLINTCQNETKEPKEEKPEEKLPQTGQLWWPIFALTISGISCIICGVLMNGKKEF